MWREHETLFVNESQVLYLGQSSRQSSNTAYGGGGNSSSSSSSSGPREAPVLVRAQGVITRTPISAAQRLPMVYFELFIKTTGGGLQPTGSVGFGLSEVAPDDSCAADSEWPEAAPLQTPYYHYYSSGRRFACFPRAGPKAGRLCGPSYGSGDTVGCGWLPSGEGKL